MDENLTDRSCRHRQLGIDLRCWAFVLGLLVSLPASAQAPRSAERAAAPAPTKGASSRTASGSEAAPVSGPEVAASTQAPRPGDLPFNKTNILAVVTSHADEIQTCYEDAMARRGSTSKDAPAGRVLMSWMVTVEGLASEVKVKQSEIKDTLVTECMVQAVRFWEFPKPEVATPIEFPFELKARSGKKVGSKREAER